MRPWNRDPVQGDIVRARLAALVAEWGDPAADQALVPDAPASDAPADGGPLEEAPRRAAPAKGAVTLAGVWEFGRAHAAAIGVVALVALLGLAFTLTQARTHPVAAATPTPVPAQQVPTASPEPTPELLRVHVVGAVHAPGVVRLEPGARVEDAVAAAGGMTADARPGELNLAAPVADGSQVVVGDASDPGGEVREASGTSSASGASGSSTASQVDLNSATLDQLDALPGVGPVTAQAILAWREEHGRFSRVDELLEVDGIGAKTLERLRDHVRV